MPNDKLEIFSQRVVRHTHNGVDSQQIRWSDIAGRRESIEYVVSNGSASISFANFGVFFIAPQTGIVVDFIETHGTAAAQGTLQLEKLKSGVKAGSGSALLVGALPLTSVADTPQSTAFVTDISARQFVKNDRFALRTTGSLASLNEVVTTMVVEYN